MPASSIHPRPPYDFDLSASIFSGGDPQIRDYSKGIFRQALPVHGVPGLVELKSSGTVDSPEIRLTFHSAHTKTQSVAPDVEQLVSSEFNFNDDLSPFYRDIAEDPIMAGISSKLRGLKVPTTPTVFEALVDSIIEQQISLLVAHRMQNRLIRAVGRQEVFQGQVYFCYPTPEGIAAASEETFRACGLSRRKAEYIRDIARKIVDGTIDLGKFRLNPDTESILAELMELRGIGRWTAELTALRGLHRFDAFPADDLGLRRLIGHYYGNAAPISSETARTIADRWGSWKGLAAYYLVVASIRGI